MVSGITCKAALRYQQFLNKVRKCDLDLQFLSNCKRNVVCPKFIRCKNIYTGLLNDKIKETLRIRNNLTKNYRIVSGLENDSTTWIKTQIIKYFVNCYQ